jgi:hypothetical protein
MVKPPGGVSNPPTTTTHPRLAGQLRCFLQRCFCQVDPMLSSQRLTCAGASNNGNFDFSQKK